MKKIVIFLVLYSLAFGARSADTYDVSTGQLTIPQVIAEETKYFDVVVTLKALVSGGNLTSLLGTTNLHPRPDTFDLKRNQLIIPAVIVENTVYRNLVVTIDKVISFNPRTESVGRSGFNGEIYPEPYQLFVASDLSATVEDGVRAALDFAVREWGNFGPLEYYIVGSDASAVRSLETQFCKQQDGRFGSEKGCLDWVQRDGAFDNYIPTTIDMLKGGTPFSSAGLRGGLPSKVIISSLPPHLSGITFEERFQVQPTGGKVILHEYWHNVQHSHIPYNIQGLDREAYLGPQWFNEGTAEYMAILAHTKRKAEERLILPDSPQYSGLAAMKSFMEEAQRGGVTDASFSVKEIPASSQLKYAVGTWATAFLFNLAGSNNVLLDAFLPSVAELGWEGAFTKAFGITPEEFYARFDAFLLLPYDEQAKILDSSLK